MHLCTGGRGRLAIPKMVSAKGDPFFAKRSKATHLRLASESLVDGLAAHSDAPESTVSAATGFARAAGSGSEVSLLATDSVLLSES